MMDQAIQSHPSHGKKWCTKCRKFRPVSEFYPCPSRRDGLRTDCKECGKAYATELLERRREGQSFDIPPDQMPRIVRDAPPMANLSEDARRAARLRMERQAREALVAVGLEEGDASQVLALIKLGKVPGIKFEVV
jgi:hypothetical protein